MFNKNDKRWRAIDLHSDDHDCQRKIDRLEKDLEEAEENFERINDLYTKAIKDSTIKAKKIENCKEMLKI